MLNIDYVIGNNFLEINKHTEMNSSPLAFRTIYTYKNVRAKSRSLEFLFRIRIFSVARGMLLKTARREREREKLW